MSLQNAGVVKMTETDTQRAPLVSIVTAAFNALPGLRRTVESVAGQTLGDVEHIVVDGGSRDGTRSYLERLGPAVRWISEPDDGIAEALNKGVAMARGAYVLVLQADDVFAGPESLERAAAYLEGGHDIVAFDILFGEGERARYIQTRFPGHRLNFKPIRHQGVIVRRDLFAAIGKFDESFRICMDYDFLLRAHRTGASITSAPVLLSRMAEGGISSRRDWQSLADRFAEERRVHLKNCPGPAMRAVYALYWPAYLAYRRLRAALAPIQSRDRG